jgi:hypothetical protein
MGLFGFERKLLSYQSYGSKKYSKVVFVHRRYTQSDWENDNASHKMTSFGDNVKLDLHCHVHRSTSSTVTIKRLFIICNFCNDSYCNKSMCTFIFLKRLKIMMIGNSTLSLTVSNSLPKTTKKVSTNLTTTTKKARVCVHRPIIM